LINSDCADAPLGCHGAAISLQCGPTGTDLIERVLEVRRSTDGVSLLDLNPDGVLAAVGQVRAQLPDPGREMSRLGIEVEVPLAVLQDELIACRCCALGRRVDGGI